MNTESNNKQPFDPVELRSLIDVMCDGTIDAKQAQRLEAIIVSDEEAMEFYIETMWMNESIARHAAGDSSRIDPSVLPVGALADSTQSQHIQQTDSNVGAEPMSIAASKNRTVVETPRAAGSSQDNWSRSHGPGAKSQSAAWPAVLAVAAALALIAGLGVLMMLNGDGNNGASGIQVVDNGNVIKIGEDPATKLENQNKSLRDNTDKIHSGKTIGDIASSEESDQGSLHETTPGKKAERPMTDPHRADRDVEFVVQKKVDSEGLKRTELFDGTIVIARAGAEFTVEKRRELRLEKGELYLIVAKSDTPFIVRTNDGEVHATGTRFSVSATDKTQAAVAQGTVVLKSSLSNIALRAGQQGTLVKSETPTRGPAKRLSHLVNWARKALAQKELLVETLPRENGLVAIDPYGQEAKLSLRKYHVDVYIEDGVARTTIDQTFFNHNPWNTEGTFYFPLPQDASVARLAMYVFGKLNEGGMVTRQRGQEIYTDILYQRRDPALLEMMEGNMFKMRIFPLEGRQEKRIFLSYTQNLEELYGATKYFFPMEHTNDITQELTIRVRIKDGAAQYDPKSSTHDLKATVEGDDLVLEYDAQKVKPDQDFLLNLLPQTEKPQPEVRVAVCKKDQRHYISAKLNPELTGVNEAQPRQWIVLNDVSASRSDIDIQAQRYVLQRLVTEADDDDSVFLIDVNTVARNISFKPINVRSVNLKPILNHRPAHVLGATNLGEGFKAAAEVVRKHKLKNPHILYLGDGVATDGEKAIADLPRLIPRSCKFIGVGIGKKVDSLFLQEAANRTGGTFATINPNEDIDWRVFDLLASINTPRMTNIQVELLDENDGLMEAIAYPSSTVLAAGETLTVTAMSDKSLPASIRFQGRVGTELVTKTASVKKAKTDAEYLPRLWAKRHIDELLKSDMSDKEEIISLSKDFYVVTPHTSLIVLEDDAMYQEYDVERGRKDHWASYDAPKEIEVIKEPLERNDWWWGRFEGEDSKIDVKARPKTAQEIIDNIQIRINAPFYIWNNQQHQPPSPSRTGLYQLCNRDTSGKSDPSKWLTLYYLLAAGDRKAAVDWSRSVAATSPKSSASSPADRKSSKSQIQQQGQYGYQAMRGPSLLSSLKSNKRLSVSGKFQRGIFFERSMSEVTPLSLLRDRQRGASARQNALPFAQFDIPTRGKGVFKREAAKQSALRPILAGAAPLPLTAEMSLSVAQAIGTRWSRLERDIEKYNSQQHYGWGERWKQRGTSINAQDLNGNWHGNQISEILEDMDFGDGEGNEEQFDFARPMSNPVVDPAMDQFGLDMNQSLFGTINRVGGFGDGRGLGRSRRMSGFANGVLSFGEGRKNLNRSGQLGLWAGTDSDGDGLIDSTWIDLGLQPMEQDFAPPPQMYIAASQRPIQTQPGMTAILAADHLSKRLDELERLANEQPDGLDKKQLAQQRAMQVAIKNIERTGARLEQNGQFWGYQGWSYRPRPQTINPPTVQAYNGYQWSFDLTRYADGLYSNTNDMFEEVARQYGSPKPLGKIDQQSREKIQQARSNFKPVEIQFDEDSAKFLVGPNDQFAFSSTSDMYLTEQLVCDGQQIVQIYDEIGIAARRSATQSRLESLRQLAPHMIPDVDSMIGQFDVELVQTDDQSTTIKLTIAEPSEEPGSEEADSDPATEKPEAEVEEQKNGETRQPESEEQSACLILKFDNHGRVLNRQLLVGDQQLYSLDLSYDDDKVTLKWKVKVEPETDEESETAKKEVASFETGESSYHCKEIDTTDSTFAIDLDTQVAIDMPLKKPEFYQQQIRGRFEKHFGKEELDKKQISAELDLSKIDRETTLELIGLYHHLSVSHLQDFSQNQWSGHQHLHTTIPLLKKLKKHAEQKYKKGELTILGASRNHYPNQILAEDEVKNFEATPLFQFVLAKRNYNTNKPSENDEPANGLIQHISLYDWICQNPSQENVESFRDRFADSPLTLALIHNLHGQKFQVDEMLKLNEDPRWEGVALLCSTNLHADDINEKVSAGFWKWQQKLAKDDQHPILVDSLLQRIKQVDPKRLTKYLSTRFDAIAKLDSLPALISFTERLGGLGEKDLASKGYQLIRKQLKIDGEETPLLHRFAYAQALWAGSRDREALDQYELILAELEEKQIQPSPGFIGAMARLCQYAGKASRAVELEERALKMEQPYLPSAINLQAFRQRYTWLWGQYRAALDKISNDPERAEKVDDLIDRASVTWRHWNEVDRDNAGLPGQMATLLKKAGRDEQAWEYLSTSIDKRPRDAATYQTLGFWYQQQGDMETASSWYKQAPQWDTANPRWIMTYANSLKELGKKKEAKIQYQKVIDGKWAPGLQRSVEQAKKLLNEL